MARLDVAIVGAGPVGAAVAALCAAPGLSIALFEARPGASREPRILALSHASRTLLEDVGAWPAARATTITSIHISQKGGPGRTLLDAAEQGLGALGYTVTYAALEEALARRLAQAGVAIHYGESCERITLERDAASLRFASGSQVEARLLVLADGGANAGKIPGIAFAEKDYEQHAVIGQGPVALLPVEERYAFVLTAPPVEAARLLALDDARFLVELQSHFGDRAGRFMSVAGRTSFPLRLRAVNVPVALRTAIVGNAAQALHPIAGQGLNLGLRDAAALAAEIAGSPIANVGDATMLDAYRGSRRRDAARGVAFTDFLATIFGDARRLPTWGRGLALTALDLFPPARRALAERMIHGARE